jgi:hypothetical protein
MVHPHKTLRVAIDSMPLEGLQHYNETSDVKSHSNRIWFDDVVVSTKPIGCLP